MEFDANIEHLQLAFWQIILTASPILGTALAVGLTIGILQAATSINEMTLSFVCWFARGRGKKISFNPALRWANI